MFPVFHVKAMSPEEVQILVPEEADLGEVYDPKTPKKDGAFQDEKLVMCNGELRRKLLHHKCTAFEGLLNWFPGVCDDAEYIRSRVLPGPFLPGPNGMVFLARFTPGYVDHFLNPFQKRDDVEQEKLTRRGTNRFPNNSNTCHLRRSGTAFHSSRKLYDGQVAETAES